MKKIYTLLLTITIMFFVFVAGCQPKQQPATAPTDAPAASPATTAVASPAAAPSNAAPAATGETPVAPASTEAGAPSPSPTEKKPRPVVTLTEAQKKEIAKLLFEGAKLENDSKIHDSIVAYVKVLQIDPNNVQAYDGKGRLQMRMMSFPDALDAFENIVDIDPKNAYAWTGIGKCKMELKDFDASIKAYEQAISLNPKMELAISGLAATYFFKGHNTVEKEKRIAAYKTSVDFYKKAIAADDKIQGNYKKLLDSAKIWWELDNNNQDAVKEAVAATDMFNKKFPKDKRLAPAMDSMIKQMQTKPADGQPIQ